MNPLVHIGYHKTGSTWLQESFFPVHSGFTLLLSHHEIFELLAKPNALEFDSAVARGVLDAAIANVENGAVPVISSEILSGSPLAGGRESKDLAERIHGSIPNARILVVIREQRAALASLYKQYVSSGGVGSMRDFFSPPVAYSYSWFDPRHYQYASLVACYLRLFGPKRVKVLLYEQLRKHPEDFIREIEVFSGASRQNVSCIQMEAVHKSLSGVATSVLRFANRFERSPSNPTPIVSIIGLRKIARALLTRIDSIGLDGAGDKRLREFVSRRFRGAFSDSNRNLEKLTGLDLRDYGYE